MIGAPALSRRALLALGAAFLVALIAAWPLSAAARMFGLDRMGVAAKSLRGPVWWGGAEELQIGGTRLGTVDVLLSPWRLALGEARLAIYRRRERPDDIDGVLSLGLGRRAILDVTGTVPAGGAMAGLGISALDFQDVSIGFIGARCAIAQGRIQAALGGGLAALNLSNGLSGSPRCEGEAVVLPLTGQSGAETLTLRIFADGRYEGRVAVRPADPSVGAALAGAGFRQAGGKRLLEVAGRL